MTKSLTSLLQDSLFILSVVICPVFPLISSLLFLQRLLVVQIALLHLIRLVFEALLLRVVQCVPLFACISQKVILLGQSGSLACLSLSLLVLSQLLDE